MGHKGKLTSIYLFRSGRVERKVMRCGIDIEPGKGLGVLQKGLLKSTKSHKKTKYFTVRGSL